MEMTASSAKCLDINRDLVNVSLVERKPLSLCLFIDRRRKTVLKVFEWGLASVVLQLRNKRSASRFVINTIHIAICNFSPHCRPGKNATRIATEIIWNSVKA